MEDDPPKLIAIDCDDYHAQHVGRTKDGRQFFLTTPFVPASSQREGSEYVALYLFDGSGKLLDAHVDDLGPRAKMDKAQRDDVYDRQLEQLGAVSFERIEVAHSQLIALELHSVWCF